jgi:catechol 2,3-dioxygenase-like lactoylglutathione lyase family enzyme
MHARFDHTALAVSDMEASIRFYRDGIGLAVVSDQVVHGDWRRLLRVDTDTLRTVQMAHAEDISVAIVELVAVVDGIDRRAVNPIQPPFRGLWLLSFRCDFEETIARLKTMGYVAELEHTQHPDPTITLRVAFLHGPDGEVVELLSADSRTTSVRLAERGRVEMV